MTYIDFHTHRVPSASDVVAVVDGRETWGIHPWRADEAFFSPSGVQSLKKNFPNFKQGDIVIGTLGPATAKAVRDAGLRLDIEAPSPQYPSISSAIDDHLRKANG